MLGGGRNLTLAESPELRVDRFGNDDGAQDHQGDQRDTCPPEELGVTAAVATGPADSLAPAPGRLPGATRGRSCRSAGWVAVLMVVLLPARTMPRIGPSRQGGPATLPRDVTRADLLPEQDGACWRRGSPAVWLCPAASRTRVASTADSMPWSC